MSGKFHWLVATALLAPLAASGCHTIGGIRHHDGCGVSQKGACQKSVCQKGGCGCDGGYRGGKLLSGVQGFFWGCNRYDGCGCGEVYWNEWQYDPPDCCDPCDDRYGCYVGPRDCCKKKFIIDPVLWVMALKGKHCRQDGWYDPCGDWHCYGDGSCGCGGCGKGGCGAGYGDSYIEGEIFEAPGVDMVPPDGTVDEVPDPTPVPAVRTGRVANNSDRSENRQASHELRR